MTRLSSIFISLLCALPLTTPSSAGDSYPDRAVRIIVPFAPGGTTDIVARVLGEELKNALGQPFIVESKPGGQGIVAIQDLARAAPDGYTLMIGNVTTNTIVPILNAKRMSANYERDVVPVMRLVDVAGLLVVTTRNFPPQTVQEFIAYARNNPDRVSYGTTGTGGYVHCDMALLAKQAGGLAMVPIPNKNGGSGLLNDLLVGTTQVAFLNAASAAGTVKAGALRALAVVNHARLPEYPDVPTMDEAGFPDVGTIAWQGLFAPAKTPKDVLEKIQAATARALDMPAVRRALEQQNFNIVPTGSLEDAKSWLAGEMNRWRKITTDLKIEIPD
jgi:tripartite-type tricarboxylate transporter receptor subunit TctC